MTQYFKTALNTSYNPKTKQIMTQSCTALYVGPNPPAVPKHPPANGIIWAPDLSKATLGTGTVTILSGPNKGQTVSAPMSQAEAQSFGTLIAQVSIANCALVSFYTGGIYAFSWNNVWQGCMVLNAKAPTSYNFAATFTNFVEYMIAHPYPGYGKDDAGGGGIGVWGAAATAGFWMSTTPPIGLVVAAVGFVAGACLAAEILGPPDPNGPITLVTEVAYAESPEYNYLSPELSAPPPASYHWGDDSNNSDGWSVDGVPDGGFTTDYPDTEEIQW